MAGKTSAYRFRNIAVVGDNFGIRQIMKFLSPDLVRCLIAASIRRQYLSDIAETSREMDVPILIQPKYGSKEYVNFLASFQEQKADLIICNSYSMMIRKDLLESVNYNAINIHWALLPKNRGPNPIQWSIIRGEAKTGVTIHYIDHDIDSGDIIAQEEVDIGFNDTWNSLRDKLARASDRLLERELPNILSAEITRMPQNHRDATVNSRLTPDSPKINFSAMDDAEIYNLIRAQVHPLKGAYVDNGGSRIYFSSFMKYEEVKELRKQYA